MTSRIKPKKPKYSQKYRKYEIHIPGTPKNLRLDICEAEWYNLKKVKKGKHKGQTKREKYAAPVPIEISEKLSDIFESYFEVKIKEGIYLLDKGQWLDTQFVRIPSSTSSRLNSVLEYLTEHAYKTNTKKLDKFAVRHHPVKNIVRHLLGINDS